MAAEPDRELLTLRDWVRRGTSMFSAAGLFYGHGTDNALDEALALVLHAVHLDHSLPPEYLDSRVTAAEGRAIGALLQRRVDTRLPAPYLTGIAYFAGMGFEVTPDVLIPRSPIAELILDRFAPWLEPEEVERVLDLCTGSGCIGIAAATAFPDATVDLADLSVAALEVAERNIVRHGLEERVSSVRADVFEGLEGRHYDLIVSNPPYVSRAEMETLPVEYGHEPALALEAGDDGLDVVARMLAGARVHLNPGGIMVVEVGSAAEALLARYPDVPFLWIDFERGGDGVFLLTAEQLEQYQDRFEEDPDE